MIIHKRLLCGLLFAALFLSATAGPALAEKHQAPLISFGQGPTEVRIYSDYFCPPCQALEPVIEPVLLDLIKRKRIRLLMVDTPINPRTHLYARYFLYALRENNDPTQAFRVRHALLDAARKQLATAEQLETLFKERGIPFQAFDIKPVAEFINSLFRSDKVTGTPTGVIIHKGKKTTHLGGASILKALEALK